MKDKILRMAYFSKEEAEKKGLVHVWRGEGDREVLATAVQIDDNIPGGYSPADQVGYVSEYTGENRLLRLPGAIVVEEVRCLVCGEPLLQYQMAPTETNLCVLHAEKTDSYV